MARFTLPRDVYHGKGSLAELKNLKGKKAILVVGGGAMKRQGFLDKAIGYLKLKFYPSYAQIFETDKIYFKAALPSTYLQLFESDNKRRK